MKVPGPLQTTDRRTHRSLRRSFYAGVDFEDTRGLTITTDTVSPVAPTPTAPTRQHATDLAITDGGTGGSSAADARTNLGVAIGSDVLAYDANLQAFVTALTLPTSDGSANRALTTNGSGTIGFSNLAPNTSIALSIILG